MPCLILQLTVKLLYGYDLQLKETGYDIHILQDFLDTRI